VIGKHLFFCSSIVRSSVFFRDGPDQPPTRFDPPGGSPYFHGGGGFHPHFSANIQQSPSAAVDQFNK